MNFKQLTRRMNSEEEAVRFFQEYHVLPSDMICENGHQMTLSLGVKKKFVGGAVKVPVVLIEWIRPGTTVISDSWCAYNGIQATGFTHQTVNHHYNFVDPATGAHTQTVERMWRSVKFQNKKQSGTARDFIESYLAEYMWRTRLNGSDPFTVILEDIAEFWPV